MHEQYNMSTKNLNLKQKKTVIITYRRIGKIFHGSIIFLNLISVAVFLESFTPA